MLQLRRVHHWALVVFSLTALYGQSEFAGVTGVVVDSDHAPMPGVTVSIRNVDTNISRKMQTNDEGYFTITSLPSGSYELTAEKEGFRAYRQTGIVLAVGQEFRSDVTLSLGSVSESVNVTAEVATLNTENGAIKGQVLVQAEIQDMPLNGRDFTELALLVPGVVTKAQGGAGSFASINGARSEEVNFRLDGFDDRNVRGADAQLRPNIDALQEFKMEVSGYSAEYGKMAGGILNMVLKSGTNQRHGSLFEYFRNEVFDAKEYFATDKLGFHQNQWGGVIAGPLSLGRLYKGQDRTFFMISWESLRNPWGQNKLGVVPSLLERAGDFSRSVNSNGLPITIRDPFSKNTPFPGNIIPASLFDPVAQKLLAYYPLPNRVGVNNYLAEAFNQNDFDNFVGRADHRFSDRDNMSVRFGKRFGRTNAPWAGSNLGEFQNTQRNDRELGGLAFTHMFTPTLLMEASGGLSRNAQREHITGGGPDTAAQLGMQGSTHDPMLRGFPLVNVTGFLSLGYGSNQPVEFFVSDIQAADKFTWIKGGHVLKWGFEVGRNRFNQPYYNNSRGTLTVNGVWSGNNTAVNGNSVADLELGLIANSSLTAQINRNYLRLTDYSWFLNDDWKAARSLTVNLGLRYEIDTPPYDRYDRAANFVPALDKVLVASEKNIPNFNQLLAQAGLQNSVGTAGQYGFPRSLQFTNYRGLAPRVGLAWRKSDRTVVRSGYGIFHSGYVLNDLRNSLDNTFPIVLSQAFAHNFADPAVLTLSNPWPQAIATLAGTTTAAGIQPHPPNQYMQSYNFTVERELGYKAVIEVAYVGSKGTHLGRQFNINQPFRSISYYQQYGANFPVPFPPLGTITYWDFNANSIYNAGQITLRRQPSGGFFYRLSYSYSKSIDNASQLSGASAGGYAQAIDARNLSLERARSDWDRGHVFQANFSWPMPVGSTKKLFGGAGKTLNGFIGNWTLAGNAIFETGPPLTILDSTVNLNLGESNRPNRIAKGNHPPGTGRQGVDFPWYVPGVFQVTPGCASRTNCAPDAYGFLPFVPGNSGRNILDGPGSQNINLSLLKRWFVGERKSIQFRWEVFNVFNHPNFLLPNRNFNETSAGYLTDVQASGQGGPRIMQFALRYEF